MATQVLQGETTILTASFYSWISSGGELIDPSLVEGFVKDEDFNVIFTFTPVRESLGVYKYSWTPSSVGDFYVEFKGTHADSTIDIVRDLFNVKSVLSGQVEATLGDDQYIHWMTELNPMYLDPEEISNIFPDATNFEIAEYIFIASSEVQEFLELDADDVVPAKAIEYIKASVLCALSRIYEPHQGSGEVITLGDLTVDSKRSPKNYPNRATAVGWCELAYVLRQEMIRASGNGPGMRAIVKGESLGNPIPVRGLRTLEP